jgi:hypothetical protein
MPSSFANPEAEFTKRMSEPLQLSGFAQQPSGCAAHVGQLPRIIWGNEGAFKYNSAPVS